MGCPRTKWSKRELRKIKDKLTLEYGTGSRAQSRIEERMLEVKTAPGYARALLRAEYGFHTPPGGKKNK